MPFASINILLTKGGFFSESAMKFFSDLQISKGILPLIHAKFWETIPTLLKGGFFQKV